MSGPWRITVDSWITDRADWYGRRTFVLDGAHSLQEALTQLADSGPRTLLDEDRLITRTGRAPKVDVPSEDDTA